MRKLIGVAGISRNPAPPAQEFILLWKDADAHLGVLKRAKAESKALH